jgi:UDP-N-acetylmuramoyl-tripeptide--D-alanyl-D-alanine ligase
LWRASDVARTTGGTLHGIDVPVHGFVTDSRTVEPGMAYVALQGERDGHEFLSDAVARGAVAALVTRHHPEVACAQVVVDDVFAALAKLGREVRDELAHVTVVGIAGSAGKTSTKDLTAAAFGGGRQVHASPKSHNNEFGVPLLMMGAPGDTDVIVAELGERKPGDLAHLAAIAAPDTAIVTHVGLAHAEFLGGRVGVAEAMAELLEALPGTGLAILNADDDFTAMLRTRTEAAVLTVGYGIEVAADIRISEVGIDSELRPSFRLESPWGSETVHLELRGEHQVANAAMAATAALHDGLDLAVVAQALGSVTGQAWRMEVTRTDDGVTILNDAYNANPASVAAALRAFQKLPVEGRRIAVLGSMFELGEHAEVAHAEVGRLVARSGIDGVVAVGDLMRDAMENSDPVLTVWAPDAKGALEAVSEFGLRAGDAVLIKASRSMGLEALADALTVEGMRA